MSIDFRGRPKASEVFIARIRRHFPPAFFSLGFLSASLEVSSDFPGPFLIFSGQTGGNLSFFLFFFFFGGNLSIKVFSLLDCGPSLGQSCKIVKNHPWASHLSKFRFLSPVCILWFPI